MAWTLIRFTTFTRNFVLRYITSFKMPKYKIKRGRLTQNPTDSKHTKKQHMLCFREKEGGIRVEPRAENNYLLVDLEIQLENLQHLPGWISELFWTNVYFFFLFSLLKILSMLISSL